VLTLKITVYKKSVRFDVLVTCYFDGSFDTSKVVGRGEREEKHACCPAIKTRIVGITYFAFYFLLTARFVVCFFCSRTITDLSFFSTLYYPYECICVCVLPFNPRSISPVIILYSYRYNILLT